MIKRFLAGTAIVVFLFGMAGPADAALTKIGVAEYDKGPYYAMIYDDTLDLVWLDYTSPSDTWQDQDRWAKGLGNVLTYYWFSGYENFEWTEDNWRLPSAGESPQEGYNQTGSDMGHLYYNGLGLKTYPDRGYTPVTDAELNQTEFNNLSAGRYWSGTKQAGDPYDAWFFGMDEGYQVEEDILLDCFGLAVRKGQISTVPVPGAIWLLGSGLAGLTLLRRKKRYFQAPF